MNILMHISSDNIEDKIDDLILKLQSERIKKKVTQHELARITGVPFEVISEIEHYAIKPSLEDIVKMSIALDISIKIN